jgi:hypothetical protein
MLAYIPKERYSDGKRQGPRLTKFKGGVPWERVDEWEKSRKFGAVYDLGENSSRPATPEEVAFYEAGLIPHIDDVLRAEDPEALWATKILR